MVLLLSQDSAKACTAGSRTALALFLLLASGCPSTPVPPPPRPELSPDTDPAIIELIESRYTAALDQPSVATARAELARAYHANNILVAACQAYEQAISLTRHGNREHLATWHYLSAHCFEESGDTEQARTSLRQALDLKADYAPAWTTLALWRLDDGDPTGAQEAFDQALALAPDSRDAASGRCRALIEKRNYENAKVSLEGLTKRFPGDRHIGFLLGTVYSQLGETDKAKPLLTLAGSSRSRAGQDPWLDSLGPLMVGYKPDLNRARAWTLGGQPGKAITLLLTMRQDRPQDPAVLTGLASAYVAARQPRDAETVLEDALEDGVESFAVHLNLGRIHQLTGDLNRALEQTERAIVLNPTLSGAWGQKGRQLFMQQRFDEARSALEEALHLDASNLEAGLLLAKSAYQMAAYPQAIATLQGLVESSQDPAEAYLILALSREKLNQPEQAAEAIRTALALPRIAPNIERALRQLARRLAS